MRIGIYNRVSSRNQIFKNSLEIQKEECTKYARYLSSEAELYFFVDKGLSGSTTDRPALQELMLGVKEKQYSHIIVSSLSRFARNSIEALSMIKTIQDNDIRFHSVKEAIDSSTALGRFSLTILASISELEREMIRDRVINTHKYLSSINRVVGSVPYGYQSLKEVSSTGRIVKTLIRDEREMAIMKRMRVLSRWYSIREIAEILNNENVKLRKGKIFPSVVWKIIKNKNKKLKEIKIAI